MWKIRLILQLIWQEFLDTLKKLKTNQSRSFPIEPEASTTSPATQKKRKTSGNNLVLLNTTMRTSVSGVSLIKQFEGLHVKRSDGRIESYPDPAGIWTIGYGHTKFVYPGMLISQEEAEDLLIEDLREAEAAVNKLVIIDLDQNQFDALVSFVFNIGQGAFARSTILRRINENQFELAGLEFDRWIYSNGKRLAGLERRRQAEAQLFMG